ncbi:MAG: RagB/SusD family nutrient uptake outer membrane protein [Bacteroidota bacterium]
MKYLASAITLLLVSGSFFSCNEEEFLTEINPNAITSETFWQTEAQFQSALTTVYGATQFQAISGGLLVNEMILGDIGGTESWYRPFAFRNLTYNDGSEYVVDKWNQLYVGIFRANQVIEFIQAADANVFDENVQAEIEAQARFLRAFFYFQVAHTYGGAVMHMIVPQVDDDFHKPFSSIEEVTNSVIIPDLQFARDNLPETWDATNTGRATWGAATSMLGKVYLFGERWADAASLFEEVINSDLYSLTPDIMDNFRHDTEFNSESIFEVAYSAELNPGVNGNAVDDNPFESGAEASIIATQFGQLNYGAFNTLLPTYYLHELFVNDEVDPENPVNDDNLQSKRLSASIVPFNAETDYYGLAVGERGGWGFGQSSYIKKYTNWYHLESEDANSRSGINFRHIRLADVYLMYAEAVIMARGDWQTALDFIDRIRTRAGVKTLAQYIDENAGSFPQLHVSEQVRGSRPLVAPSAETVLTHIKRVERPIELCFEGHRWKDLVRWGMVEEVFDELRADEIWRQNNTGDLNITAGGVAPLFIVERIRPDFIICADSYQSAAHDYLPIPTQERQNNNMIN